eukprot:g17651.t1
MLILREILEELRPDAFMETFLSYSPSQPNTCDERQAAWNITMLMEGARRMPRRRRLYWIELYNDQLEMFGTWRGRGAMFGSSTDLRAFLKELGRLSAHRWMGFERPPALGGPLTASAPAVPGANGTYSFPYSSSSSSSPASSWEDQEDEVGAAASDELELHPVVASLIDERVAAAVGRALGGELLPALPRSVDARITQRVNAVKAEIEAKIERTTEETRAFIRVDQAKLQSTGTRALEKDQAPVVERREEGGGGSSSSCRGQKGNEEGNNANDFVDAKLIGFAQQLESRLREYTTHVKEQLAAAEAALSDVIDAKIAQLELEKLVQQRVQEARDEKDAEVVAAAVHSANAAATNAATEAVRTRLGEFGKNMGARLDDMEAQVGGTNGALRGNARELADALKKFRSLEAQVEETRAFIGGTAARWDREVGAGLDRIATESAGKFEALTAENERNIEALKAESVQKLKALEAETATKIDALKADTAGKFEALAADNAANWEAERDYVRETLEKTSERLGAEMAEDVRQTASQLEQKMESTEKEIGGKITKLNDQKTTELQIGIGELEGRVSAKSGRSLAALKSEIEDGVVASVSGGVEELKGAVFGTLMPDYEAREEWKQKGFLAKGWCGVRKTLGCPARSRTGKSSGAEDFQSLPDGEGDEDEE